MPLYEKFGLDPQLFTKKHFKSTQESIFTCLNKKPPCASLVSSYKSDLISASCRLCFDYYLLDKEENIERYAKPMLDYAIEYFFGDWRKDTIVEEQTGEEYFKRSELWISDFRESILWGSVLGEWNKIKEISKYPDELCMEADFEPKETSAWYILLAIYLREGSLANADEYIGLIENGRKKREKLLLNVLRAITAEDEDGFANEFGIYMKYYKSREFPRDSVHETLAIDGTILFNLAKYKGMQVEFPRAYIDHYINLGKGNNKARHSGTVKNSIGV